MNSRLCPCHSSKLFSKCCQPFLSAALKARTVTQLMRSRYSAYALGGYGDYLYQTWHPDGRGALLPIDLDLSTVRWTHLEVLQAQQSGNTGSVEFIARFSQADGGAGTHHEVSAFVRVSGQWLYRDGHEIDGS